MWCVPCGLCARQRGTPALAHEDEPLGRLLCVPPRQFTSCCSLQAIRAHVVGRAGVMSRLFLQPERSRQSRMQPQNGRQRVGTARSRWSQGRPRVRHASPACRALQRRKFRKGVYPADKRRLLDPCLCAVFPFMACELALDSVQIRTADPTGGSAGASEIVLAGHLGAGDACCRGCTARERALSCIAPLSTCGSVELRTGWQASRRCECDDRPVGLNCDATGAALGSRK